MSFRDKIKDNKDKFIMNASYEKFAQERKDNKEKGYNAGFREGVRLMQWTYLTGLQMWLFSIALLSTFALFFDYMRYISAGIIWIMTFIVWYKARRVKRSDREKEQVIKEENNYK